MQNGYWMLLAEDAQLLPSDQWLVGFDQDGMPTWEIRPANDDQATPAACEVWRRWIDGPACAMPASGIDQDGTRRDVLAGMCLQGLLANPYDAMHTRYDRHDLAGDAVEYADELLAALDALEDPCSGAGREEAEDA